MQLLICESSPLTFLQASKRILFQKHLRGIKLFTNCIFQISMNVMCMDNVLNSVSTQKEATNVLVNQVMVWSLIKRHAEPQVTLANVIQRGSTCIANLTGASWPWLLILIAQDILEYRYSGLEIKKIIQSHISLNVNFQSQNQIEETQSIDIHDVLNAQGFAMHYRAISNTGSHFEVSESERVLLYCVL